MEPGGAVPHLQGLTNNTYPEPYQPQVFTLSFYTNTFNTYFFKIHSNIVLPSQLCLDLHRCLFPVGLPIKI